MPSVIGLLEGREKEIREEVARLRAALEEAERALQRLVDARVTVTEVLSGEPDVAPKSALKRAVAGSTVPHRTAGMAASVLAVDYQYIVGLLESDAGREGMRCQQLAAALGLEVVPAKVEGLRSKAKRLAERGWIRQVRPLMNMVIDHSTMASCMTGSVS
ncbi:hypothetical protein [Streptomyces sp. NPDC052036]|uniref:hypothetical protein n=1 Tax=Streptomyces sp. NPDC052036 TaxID=3155171 RepID=UPI0034141E40